MFQQQQRRRRLPLRCCCRLIIIFMMWLVVVVVVVDGFASSSSISKFNNNNPQVVEIKAPTWDDLETQLLSTDIGQLLAEELEQRKRGYGPKPHIDCKVRRFNNSNVVVVEEDDNETDIDVTLYRDSSGWCPYCQKV